jgi:hypothetical protein
VLQKWDNIGQFVLPWCGSQSGVSAPDENRFTTLRAGEVGIRALPFRCQRGDSGETTANVANFGLASTTPLPELWKNGTTLWLMFDPCDLDGCYSSSWRHD